MTKDKKDKKGKKDQEGKQGDADRPEEGTAKRQSKPKPDEGRAYG